MAKDLKLTGQKLTEIPFFSNLSLEEAETLLQIVNIRIFKENEPIFREGTPGTSLFVILEGTVDVVKKVDDKTFRSLARLTRDSVFGEIALLQSGEVGRTASVVARERTRVMELHKEDFARLIEFGSIVAYKVAFSISHILAARLSSMDQQMVNLVPENSEPGSDALTQYEKSRNEVLEVETVLTRRRRRIEEDSHEH